MILIASNNTRLVSAVCFVPQMSIVLIDWVASNTPIMFQLFAGSTDWSNVRIYGVHDGGAAGADGQLK